MGSGIVGAHPFPHIVPPPPLPLNLEDDQRLSNIPSRFKKKSVSFAVYSQQFTFCYCQVISLVFPCFLLKFDYVTRQVRNFLLVHLFLKKSWIPPPPPPPPERSYVTTFWHRILRSHGREITRALKINDV